MRRKPIMIRALFQCIGTNDGNRTSRGKHLIKINPTFLEDIVQTTTFPLVESPAPPLSPRRPSLNGALIEFFAHSKAASTVLRLLSRKSRPVGYRRLMDEIRFDAMQGAGDGDLPAAAIRAVLSISQAAGLIRLTRHGFSITEIGREVHRRLAPAPA
jgi:hypothetical protein